MKTRRGIYTDLQESDYVFTIGEIKFYFSSKFYLNKFIKAYEEETRRFNQSLNNVYKDKFDIRADVLSWLRLYTLIEKRGFYLLIEGIEITCPDDLVFVVTLNSKTKFAELINSYKTNSPG